MGPLFFGMLAEKLGELAKGKRNSEARKELMQAFAATVLSILQTQLPDVMQKLSDGRTDAWTAFKTITKALTFDPDSGLMSPLLADVLGKLAEFCAARLAETTGVSYAITAEIVDNDNDEYGVEKGSINFDWACSGRYGSLYSLADANLSQPNKFTSSKNFASPNYLPNGEPADGAAETISVKAYFEPIGAKGTRQLIGGASTAVKFRKAFSLSITPPAMDLPADETLSLVCSVVETLPKTASVRYE